ncbi:MAG: hypothetical protein V1792_26440 [Pseudomonadota bacterium]
MEYENSFQAVAELSIPGGISGDIHLVLIDSHEIFMPHDPMARLSRIVVPGFPHHVTQRGVRSMNVFHEESDRREYLGMPGEKIARHGDAAFVARVEKTTGRDLSKGKPGRPRKRPS